MSGITLQTPEDIADPYSRTATRDFDEFADAHQGVDLRLRQFSSARFHGEAELVTIDSLQIVRSVVNCTLQARGVVGANVALFSPITPQCESARWRGLVRRPGEININRPATEIDHLTSPVYDSITIVADLERLRVLGRSMHGVDIDPFLRGTRPSCPATPRLPTLLGWLTMALNLGRTQPEMLHSAQVRAQLEENLVENLLHALIGGSTLDETGSTPHRQQLAQRAEEFMLANLRRQLLMTDLCVECGVSERTLRYAFRDNFGISPLAYFKALKLNEIRRQYLALRTGDCVQEIARQWGIVHLGNFAAEYRRLFGELPSDTVRQRNRLHTAMLPERTSHPQ